MTAHPDPTPPPASTDPYVAGAQQRVLTLAEKRAQPVDKKLDLLRVTLRKIRRDDFASMVDKRVIDVLDGVLDVVEQVAGQVGTS